MVCIPFSAFIDNHNHSFFFDASSANLGQWLYEIAETYSFKMLLGRHTPNSTSDWEQVLERLAHIFTETFQSPWNANATLIHGDAYAPEIFVRVRWLWLTMPVCIVVASSVLLCITMHRSRKKTFLYKNSILATLFHGLDGQDLHETAYSDANVRQSHHAMLENAKSMKALMQRDDDGSWKLRRE